MQKSVWIADHFYQLQEYCEAEEFKGWDPYDGLNSRLFQSLGLNRVGFFRLAWIQLFKRNPINLRRLLGVPKEHNPKGLGLFLSGYCHRYNQTKRPADLAQIRLLADLLLALQTTGYHGSCWGYNFDWQSRAFFLPKGTPTVVVTSFVACALFDAYAVTGDERYRESAISSAEFILKDLNRTPQSEGFIFSYSPHDHTQVYNASLLGSKLLARIYHHTKAPHLLEMARASVVACAKAQREDGAWIYGALKIQNWVDSFHTGFNLEAIYTYAHYSGDRDFDGVIDRGLAYYLRHFFLPDGTPKYYDTQTYPIDIHAPAQLVITLSRLNRLHEHQALVDRVMGWTFEKMFDKRGYFYYQRKKINSSKIPYMRWSQAWMFYALSLYLE